MNNVWEKEADYACGVYRNRRWVMMRGPMKSWCGYAEYFVGPVDNDSLNIDCHGGLTFSGMRPFVYWDLQDSPYRLKTVDVYCVGFDCAHHMDLMPMYLDPDLRSIYSEDIYSKSVYRDYDYVLTQIRSIIDQLWEKDFTKEN